jgi:hypothetical protein
MLWRWYLVVSIWTALTALGAYGLWRAYRRERFGLILGCGVLLAHSGLAFGMYRQVFGPGAERLKIMAFLLGLVALGSLIEAADRRHDRAVAAWALAVWIAGAIGGAAHVPEREGDPDANEEECQGVPARYC